MVVFCFCRLLQAVDQPDRRGGAAAGPDVARRRGARRGAPADPPRGRRQHGQPDGQEDRRFHEKRNEIVSLTSNTKLRSRRLR